MVCRVSLLQYRTLGTKMAAQSQREFQNHTKTIHCHLQRLTMGEGSWHAVHLCRPSLLPITLTFEGIFKTEIALAVEVGP